MNKPSWRRRLFWGAALFCLLAAMLLWPGLHCTNGAQDQNKPASSSSSDVKSSEETPPQDVMPDVAPPDVKRLGAFFRALDDLEKGRRHKPVVIVQLGDSHTAGDKFSGRLRQLFQEKFGNSGRGMLPPGEPFRHFRPTDVMVTQTEGWVVHNSHRSSDDGIFGLTGFRTSGSNPEDEMVLTSRTDEVFDKAEIEFLGQPGGGTVKIVLNGEYEMEVYTIDKEVRPKRVLIFRPGKIREIAVSPVGDGPVDVLSWTVEKDNLGVVYDSQGIIGATINVINRWDPEVTISDLKHRDPSLLVVEYGGNEGFDDDLRPEVYEKQFRSRIEFLKSAVPEAAILVIGPADGLRLPRYCLKKDKSGDPIKKANEFPCGPLTDEEREDYQKLRKKKDRALCRWHPPPKLSVVREIQRSVAEDEGYAFWDWSTVMGGECGIYSWVNGDPPMAAPDHLHLVQEGAALSAETLFDLLMDYYRVFLAKQETSPPQ